MNGKSITALSAVVTALIWLGILSAWILQDPVADFTILTPGLDGFIPGQEAASRPPIHFGEINVKFDIEPPKASADWPRFRGERFDNINREKLALTDHLEAPLSPLWSVTLGEGHAGAAVADGRVFILDYDEIQNADVLRCFALTDGRELWQLGYKVKIKRNHGMSRTVPAVMDNVVVTMGPRCHVMAADVNTGELLWGLDLELDFGVEVPLWYTGQCPLIDGSTAVLAVGGDTVLMMGVNIQTGLIEWSLPNPDGWKMSHSSIMSLTLAGKRQYVYCAVGGTLAVSAEPEDKGTELWQSTLWTQSVLAPSPLLLPGDRIFLTAGYGAGSMMLQISSVDGQFQADSLYTTQPGMGLSSEQQTPILVNDQVCGILPKDGGAMKEEFVCYSADDTRRVMWSSGKTSRFGLGPYILADGKFLVLSDDGVLNILDAQQNEYRLLSSSQVLPGHDAWAPMALVEGKLLLRDSQTMICIDLAQNGVAMP